MYQTRLAEGRFASYNKVVCNRQFFRQISYITDRDELSTTNTSQRSGIESVMCNCAVSQLSI